MATQVIDLVNTCEFTWTYQGTIASDTTTDSTAVDCKDVDGPLHMAVLVGNYGDADTQAVVSFIECDTSGGAYSAITDGDTLTLAASASANDNKAFLLKADKRSKRYVKARVVTSGGGSVSVPLAIGILGRKKISGGGDGSLLTV